MLSCPNTQLRAQSQEAEPGQRNLRSPSPVPKCTQMTHEGQAGSSQDGGPGAAATVIAAESALERELLLAETCQKEQGGENFICREIKRCHQDPGSQLAFKQLSSLGKTKVTASCAFSRVTVRAGVSISSLEAVL